MLDHWSSIGVYKLGQSLWMLQSENLLFFYLKSTCDKYVKFHSNVIFVFIYLLYWLKINPCQIPFLACIFLRHYINTKIYKGYSGITMHWWESVLGYSTISFIKTHATFFTFRLLSLLRKDHMTQNQLTLCDIKCSVPVSNL